MEILKSTRHAVDLDSMGIFGKMAKWKICEEQGGHFPGRILSVDPKGIVTACVDCKKTYYLKTNSPGLVRSQDYLARRVG